MVSGILNLLYFLGIFKAEVFLQFSQVFGCLVGEFEELFVRQKKKIFYLDKYAVFNQREFRKIFIQMLNVFSIATVDRGNSREGGNFHFFCLILQLFVIQKYSIAYKKS